ncbi:uncharacterized protein EV420DRAFT_1636330 [Desarmillaria tabescens]|uniref:Uncharacterized protein n=1 Tax=Armillaria tabescens TaxID=1929756 RepID=A0AA39NKG2_ARMTA|nr:uncharacterized protein EV420DRAFT_1636330 [Desarmillaria tabescens]KAK0467317.1 hypothetical protein EV420DRAFT_1636330 [Desarmillaria tabescens]
MDVDWCLTCERHLSGNWTYCSPECQRRAPANVRVLPLSSSSAESDDEPIYHTIHDVSTSGWTSEKIQAWATVIPPASVPRPQRAYRTPKLLSQSRTPPTVAMTVPEQSRSDRSLPISLPKKRTTVLATLADHLRTWAISRPCPPPEPSPTDSFITLPSAPVNERPPPQTRFLHQPPPSRHPQVRLRDDHHAAYRMRGRKPRS